MPSSIGHRSWGQQQQQQQQQSVIQKWALVRPYILQDLLVGQRDLISRTWWLSLPAHCCCWSGCWSWVHHSIYWRSVPARSGSCNVFKGLFHSTIPLLKGPVLRASVHLTGDVLRGKTMKQALKNRVTLLVGDLLQASSQEAHNSCQAAGQQEVGTRAGVDLETPSPQRHLRLIKQAHLYVSISLVRRPFLKHVSYGLHTTALCAMHQEWTGPGERATLADQHHQWLPGAHWPKVRSGEWWTSTVPDPHQQWWQPGPQPLLPVPEVLGP